MVSWGSEKSGGFDVCNGRDRLRAIPAVLLSEQCRGGDCREASQRRDVPSGFRYAKHSDEPKAECLAYLNPNGTQPAFHPWPTTKSAHCSLNNPAI